MTGTIAREHQEVYSGEARSSNSNAVGSILEAFVQESSVKSMFNSILVWGLRHVSDFISTELTEGHASQGC